MSFTAFDVPVAGGPVICSFHFHHLMRGVAEQYHTLVWCSVPFVRRQQHPQPTHDEARVVRSVRCIDERARRGDAAPTHQSGVTSLHASLSSGLPQRRECQGVVLSVRFVPCGAAGGPPNLYFQNLRFVRSSLCLRTISNEARAMIESCVRSSWSLFN